MCYTTSTNVTTREEPMARRPKYASLTEKILKKLHDQAPEFDYTVEIVKIRGKDSIVIEIENPRTGQVLGASLGENPTTKDITTMVTSIIIMAKTELTEEVDPADLLEQVIQEEIRRND